MSSVRRHSIFGDYILVDKPHPRTNVPVGDVLADIRDYNALWGRYAKEVSGEYGSILTEKGFEKWLQNQMKKEAKNAE